MRIKMALISVIVPIFRVEDYLERCIKSILNQSFSDFELILVVDGSPDDCSIISDMFAEKDSRVSVFHKTNGGLSDARNIGIEYALNNKDCEWITFIDSDDWIYYRYLESLYCSAVETSLPVSICSFEHTTTQNPIVDDKSLKPEIWNTEDFYCDKNVNAVIAVCKLYKKELFEDIRFPVGKIHEDEFTTYKVIFKSKEICYINQPLYAYFRNSAGIMGEKWTPKKLVSIEAFENSIHFFQQCGYEKAFAYRSKELFYNIYKHRSKLLETYDLELIKQYLPFLKKKQKEVFFFCKKNGVFSFKDTKWAYEIAFPKLMKIYWSLVALKNKFKR